VIGPLGRVVPHLLQADKGKRGHLKPKRTPMMQPLPLHGCGVAFDEVEIAVIAGTERSQR